MNRVARWTLWSTVGIFVLVASVTPALAAITTAQLTAGSPNSNGPCPFTETFTGSINGTPGTSFQYSFNRYINGTQQIQNIAFTVTIPASGSLAVNDSLKISGTSSGVNFDQIWAHNIAGGQADVYSNRAAFSVNCGAPPSPGGSPANFSKFGARTTDTANQLVYGVPTPYNLASTTDPHVCGKHGGLAGVFCIQAVPDKYLILVWDWDPNSKWPSIDGYHIYDVTGGGKTRVQDQTNPQATVEFFKPGSFTGKCYAVSAYKGTNESLLSASVCAAGAAVGVKTLSLTPNPGETHVHEYCGSGLCGVPNCDVVACAGWTHSKGSTGHYNNFQRGYLLFDPGQIAGRNVYVAKLYLVLEGDPLCLGGVGIANGPWVGTPWDTVPPATLDLSIPKTISNANAAFDVTSIVRDWARGGPNNGLVLFGTNENTGAEDNGYCIVGAAKAVLAIQYY